MRTASSSGSGQSLSRRELAELVVAYLDGKVGRQYPVDANYLGKLERGEFRWPHQHYRDAFRAVLSVQTDALIADRPGARGAGRGADLPVRR